MRAGGGAGRGPGRDQGGARPLALRALVRVDEGAYANLVLPALLADSALDRRDRAFATELVYGTTRMRRACDWLTGRHCRQPLAHLEPTVRNALRLGAYQLAFAGVPPHAAVAATVSVVSARARGLVNAVLRKVAADLPPPWPDSATRLSYPDWVLERLCVDLGETVAMAALEEMNRPAAVTARDDGYIQDRASQWVTALVEARAGERVGDLCASPGGKATGLASAGAHVLAGDRHEARARLMAKNVGRLGVGDRVGVVVADGTRPPVRAGALDRVLVDAPCTGLGALRRRPDARWRVTAADVEALVDLQRRLLAGALTALRRSGVLVYSVCTLTAAETTGIDAWLAAAHPELEPLPAPAPPWQPAGRGALLLPQAAGTDGMFVLRLRRA